MVQALRTDLRHAGDDHSSVGVAYQNYLLQPLALQKFPNVLDMKVQIDGCGVDVSG
jgi:hypothetical protein